MKLYATNKYTNNEILFEKKSKKQIHYKMKLYTTSEYMNNYISFRLMLFACSLQIRQYFPDNIF